MIQFLVSGAARYLSKTIVYYFLGLATGISLTCCSVRLLLLTNNEDSDQENTSSELNANSCKRHQTRRSGIQKLVFDTPLVKIESLSKATGCDIYGKCEFLSVTGSPKGRVGLAIIENAEKIGVLKPHTGSTVFEGTVGSTGIALAIMSRVKGYHCHIVMPDDQAKEKYQILEALGATVEKVKPCSIIDSHHFVNIARQRAKEMSEKNEEAKGYFCNQFENQANLLIHYETTGPEIYSQMNGHIDAFVMGAGTGGTLAGVSLYLKPRIPKMKIILSDPQGSGLYNKVKFGVMYASTEKEGSRKRHQVDTIVEGIGLNRMTKNFEKIANGAWIDDAISVSDEDAVRMSRFIMKNDGLFLGSSSAVNLVAAYRSAKKMGPGQRIVTILCDGGSRHLTKFWNEEYIEKQNLSDAAKNACLELI